MKIVAIILTLAALPTVLSCRSGGLSEETKGSIKLYIDMHNVKTGTKFSMDSIDEATRYKISIIQYKNDVDVEDFTKTHMEVFANEWNKPYSIQKDRFLTMDRYLEYCKANNLDAETYYKFID